MQPYGYAQPAMQPTMMPGQPMVAQPMVAQPIMQPVMAQPMMAMPAPQQTTNTTIIKTGGSEQSRAPIVSVFRENPVQTTCRFCNNQVVTSTTTQTGSLAWLLCFVLCIIGLWVGCCLIPCCMDGCKDVRHTCPSCGNQLGVYKRL